MLIKNIHLENSAETTDIRINDGVFGEIAPSLQALPGEEVIDGTGKMILPPFIESHVHLDTCLTAEIRSGICPAPYLKALNAGANGRKS